MTLRQKPINELTDAELTSLTKGAGEKHIRAEYGPAWAPVLTSGRPKKDSTRQKAQEMRKKGYSWARLTREMNRLTGDTKSQNAYRNLLNYCPKNAQ